MHYKISIKLWRRTRAAITNTTLTRMSGSAYILNGSQHSTITLARDLQSTAVRPNFPLLSTVLTFVKYVGCLRDPGSYSIVYRNCHSLSILCKFCASIYLKYFLIFYVYFQVRQDPVHLYDTYTRNINLFNYLTLLHHVNCAQDWRYAIFLWIDSLTVGAWESKHTEIFSVIL
jgi:hypothetical protein